MNALEEALDLGPVTILEQRVGAAMYYEGSQLLSPVLRTARQ